jgi:hypothetical protein
MWLSCGEIEDKQGKENGDGDKKGKKADTETKVSWKEVI